MAGRLLLFTNVLVADSRVGQLVRLLQKEYEAPIWCLHPDWADQPARMPEGMRVNVFRRPYWKSCFKFRRFLRERNIAAIWCYNLPPLPYAIVAAIGMGVHIIMNFAGEDLQFSREYDYGYRKTLSGEAAFQTLMRFPRRFVCMSPMTADLAERAHLPRKRIVVIPNMFDIDRDFPACSEDQTAALRKELGIGSKIVVLCVASHRPTKQIARLISGYELFKRRRPESFLLLVGQGELMQDNRQLAEKLGISDSVRFIPNVSRDRISTFYALADVSCNLSHQDAFCNPVVESFTQGTPVLASRGVGVGRYLDGEPFFRCVDNDGPEDVAHALEAVIAEDIKRRYSDQAMAAARRFDVSRVLPVWREFLDEMLQ